MQNELEGMLAAIVAVETWPKRLQCLNTYVEGYDTNNVPHFRDSVGLPEGFEDAVH